MLLNFNSYTLINPFKKQVAYLGNKLPISIRYIMDISTPPRPKRRKWNY